MELYDRSLTPSSQSERSRWPALAAKMTNLDIMDDPRLLTLREKFDRWYVDRTAHGGVVRGHATVADPISLQDGQ